MVVVRICFEVGTEQLCGCSEHLAQWQDTARLNFQDIQKIIVIVRVILDTPVLRIALTSSDHSSYRHLLT